MIGKKIKVAIPITGEEEAAAIREVVLSGNFVSGKNVSKFESEFSNFIGVSHAAAVNNGTAALHIALALLGIGPGDEVIVPSLTFMSTITAVLHQNAIPVFTDIDKKSYCISPDDIKKKITNRTKAIIPVHLFGNAADMDRILDLCNTNNLFVVEDCAQSHGTEYKGQRVGSIGHIGAFSFFATKQMTTGEGGIITSNNEEWIEKAKKIRSHGMSGRDDHDILGYNYRMNEMEAAMGLVQLKKLPDLNKQRIKNSLYILEQIGKVPSKFFISPELNPNIKHTFFWCPLQINPKGGISTSKIVQKLKNKGIEVRQRYQSPLYKQKVIQDLSPYPYACPFRCLPKSVIPDYKNVFLPNVEEIAGNIIGLPNHPALTQEELDYIVDTIINLS
jgi:perosamine synthetase